MDILALHILVDTLIILNSLLPELNLLDRFRAESVPFVHKHVSVCICHALERAVVLVNTHSHQVLLPDLEMGLEPRSIHVLR